MENEVTVVESNVPVPKTPMEMVSFALQRGDGLDVIEKLMDLQDRHEQKEAKREFIEAKAAFKAEAPNISKDMNNKQYGSKYTSKGNLINTVNPILSKHGFDVHWEPEQSDGVIKITCVLTHKAGHSERVTMSGPPDDSGKKNPLQQIKSTKTYLEIATFESITGLASLEGEDDGNGAFPVEKISEDQSINICALASEVSADDKKFCKFFGIKEIDDLPASKYNQAIKMLEAKRDN